MSPKEIARKRLGSQGISGNFDRVVGVVSGLLAMQAQDYSGALWGIGLRVKGCAKGDVEAAIERGEIVRTWPMRGTLHFVAAGDVRWLLELLSPRVIAGAATRARQLELDAKVFGRCEKVFVKALRGGKRVRRSGMMELLEGAGISTKEQRGYHILWRLSQEGVLCCGPHEGKEQTFVLLDEWVAVGRKSSEEEARARLALRYFVGHGPATIADLAWWSGMKISDARAGLESVKRELVNEGEYWMAEAPEPKVVGSTFLLPGFDEYLLGYKDRSAVLDGGNARKVCPGGNGMFMPMVVKDGRIVGTWKRVVGKKGVKVVERLFDGEKAEVSGQVGRYAEFVKVRGG